MTNHDIVDDARPMPPSREGRLRYAGTHELSPHHANSVHAFIAVIAIVMRPTGGSKIAPMRPRGADCAEPADFQISGSSTFRCTHTVNSAGTMPTKKTPRHPQTGRTSRLTSAASP